MEFSVAICMLTKQLIILPPRSSRLRAHYVSQWRNTYIYIYIHSIISASGFEAFGAVTWAERAVRAEAGATADAVPGNAPASAVNTFRSDGDTRTVSFDGATVLIHDLKGCRYLERLLMEPNREFHVLDLVAVEQGSLPTVPSPTDREGVRREGGHAGVHLDDQAREAYNAGSSISTRTSRTRHATTTWDASPLQKPTGST